MYQHPNFLIWDNHGPGLEQLPRNTIKISEALAAEILERGECEFVFDVAAKLPVFTFCEMGIWRCELGTIHVDTFVEP